MSAGAPYNNSNAEKWDFETAEKLMKDAVELSFSEGFDFIGEVAKQLGTYIDVFDYLTDKFPELEKYKKQLKRNCEVNCFSNGKTGKIVSALSIMNLKSNHGWTDRIDTKSDVNLNGKISLSDLVEFKGHGEDNTE